MDHPIRHAAFAGEAYAADPSKVEAQLAGYVGDPAGPGTAPVPAVDGPVQAILSPHISSNRWLVKIMSCSPLPLEWMQRGSFRASLRIKIGGASAVSPHVRVAEYDAGDGWSDAEI
jgi:hypothetical protein